MLVVRRTFWKICLSLLLLITMTGCNSAENNETGEIVAKTEHVHVMGVWKQDEPCDKFEHIRCTTCNEKIESREAAKRHNYDSEGICQDCKEKVYFTEQEIRGIIQIQKFDVGEYNGEALSDIKIVWKNTSQKTIKRVEFIVTAKYNNEKDATRCESKTSVAPGEIGGQETCWSTLWPSGMSGEQITSIKIFYDDGSNVHINDSNGSFLQYVFG